MTATTTTDNVPIVEKTIARLGEIATLPEVTVKIIELVEDPKSTARDLHELIKSDPALSARVLKVVNSAFYGLPGKVANLDRAVALLGLSAVKNIAIAASISRIFQSGRIGQQFSAKDLWAHSVAVGVASRMLCLALGPKIGGEELFLAGLIHDLGILVERQAFPEQLAEAVGKAADQGGGFCQSEQAILGADHQAFGQVLTAKWRFPVPLQYVVGQHHSPEHIPAEYQVVGAIVHLADVLCCQERIGFYLTAADETITPELMDLAGVTDEILQNTRANLAEQIAEADALLRG